MKLPVLYTTVEVPECFCTAETVKGNQVIYGGDIRIGDLRNLGRPDFLVYRSVGKAHDEGGMKPCFIGAFDAAGSPLWSAGTAGTQPCRPGPVAVHDIDRDGRTEIICFFLDGTVEAEAGSMEDVVIQVRDGATGSIKNQAAPEAFLSCRGYGPNWAHQRILIANFRGMDTPGDFVVKLGQKVLAFDSELNLLWEYTSCWTEYGHCPAYIPAVGDIDGDGRDEVNGGYFLLDHDGTVLWEKDIASHNDSVAIDSWDGGRIRAICSGHGQVLDHKGRVVMKLGGDMVPHGQEVRTGFFAGRQEPYMVIRYNGHDTGIIVVDTSGKTVRKMEINFSPNNTGMEAVYWEKGSAVIYNGGMLWDVASGYGAMLPELPGTTSAGRMDWYHCIPADICGDGREEAVLYNPWGRKIYVYTQQDNDMNSYRGFHPGPRQYNARIMD